MVRRLLWGLILYYHGNCLPLINGRILLAARGGEDSGSYESCFSRPKLGWILPNPIVWREAALSKRAQKGSPLQPSPRRSRAYLPRPRPSSRWERKMEPVETLSTPWKRYCYIVYKRMGLCTCPTTLTVPPGTPCTRCTGPYPNCRRPPAQ